MFNSLDQWLSYIEKLHSKQIDMGLSRVTQLADRLNLRQFRAPVITIGGTNGKGSTVATLESIYAAAGFSVGAYTSPHLLKFNERIRINQKMIDDEKLMSAFHVIEAERQALNITLSFFEFTTLAALFLFQQANLSVILLEVGMGGRLDAVNIVNADVAIISSIALDHMEWLGDTRELIAIEKMGIARPHRPLICADENSPAVIATHCLQQKIPLYQSQVDFYYTIKENSFEWETHDLQLTFSNLPILKVQNCASALMAVHCLQNRLPVSKKELEIGVLRANLLGRFEKRETPFPMILDVAHNPHATLWTAEQLQDQFPNRRFIALFGMLKDKDIQQSVKPLLCLISDWYVVGLSVDRGARAEEIASILCTEGVKNCYTFASVTAALNELLKQHRIHKKILERVLVFGSFYVVSEAMNYLNQGDKQWNLKQSKDILAL